MPCLEYRVCVCVCVCVCVLTSSQIFSSLGIHEVARWQFCSTTHEPSMRPLSIMADAIGPWRETLRYHYTNQHGHTWPCPRDIDWQCFPLSSANLSSPAMGSAPGDSTNISGAQQCESAKLPARSKVGGSMYCLPILSTMKFWTAGTILSGLIQRSATIL